jgi:hypothetical protein
VVFSESNFIRGCRALSMRSTDAGEPASFARLWAAEGAAIPLPLYADIEMVNEWLTRTPIGFQNARSPANSRKISLREVGAEGELYFCN